MADIFVKENTDGTDNGLALLLSGIQGAFYQEAGNAGLIGAEDVVLIKINAQWAERGGTNTDLLKALVRFILDHPEGFRGEIIIADNGQGMFGSRMTGGRLDWESANSKDKDQSAQKTADHFDAPGQRVSAVLCDTMTRTKTAEFDTGDEGDGFVVEEGSHPTGLVVSYPKFTTKYGTRVSFKKGIWKDGTYDTGALKVINMPVLKAHFIYQVTGAMKSYMGTPSNSLTAMSPHNSVGRGGMGTQMVQTRVPVLNILDMVWIGPVGGPGITYAQALEKDMVACSTDPVALDYWASKNILLPAAKEAGSPQYGALDPDVNEQGHFGHWLRLALEELNRAGFDFTMDEAKIKVHYL
jgi:hypothetical protein